MHEPPGWTLFNALQWLFTLFWTAGWICLALLGARLAARRRRTAGSAWLERIDWSRPHVFVANHPSMIDICALFRALPVRVPVRFVLKQELAKAPFFGWYARAMGTVFIERGSARNSARQLHAAVDVVRPGASVCAFPEGGRSREGRAAPFMGGAFQLAIEAGASVVPVAIEGSGELLPAAGFHVRPGRIVVRLGEPLPTQGLAPHDRNTLAGQARAAVAALL